MTEASMSAMIYLSLSFSCVVIGGLALFLAELFSPVPRSAEVVVRVSERARAE